MAIQPKRYRSTSKQKEFSCVIPFLVKDAYLLPSLTRKVTSKMKYVHPLELFFGSLIFPGYGYLRLGMWLSFIATWVVLFVAVLFWLYLGLAVMLLAAISSVSHAGKAKVEYERAKSDEMLYELRKANRIRESDSN